MMMLGRDLDMMGLERHRHDEIIFPAAPHVSMPEIGPAARIYPSAKDRDKIRYHEVLQLTMLKAYLYTDPGPSTY